MSTRMVTGASGPRTARRNNHSAVVSCGKDAAYHVPSESGDFIEGAPAYRGAGRTAHEEYPVEPEICQPVAYCHDVVDLWWRLQSKERQSKH